MNINFKREIEEQLGRELTDEEFEEIEKANSEYDQVSSIEDEE